MYFIIQASSEGVFADLTNGNIAGSLGSWNKQSEWPTETEILN
jgi:hypothetical protein